MFGSLRMFLQLGRKGLADAANGLVDGLEQKDRK